MLAEKINKLLLRFNFKNIQTFIIYWSIHL